MKEKTFKFRESFAVAVKAMDDNQAGRFIKGLCDYAFDRKPFKGYDKTLDITFPFVKNILDQEFIDRENGKIGGRIRHQMRKCESPVALFTEVSTGVNPLQEIFNMVLEKAEKEQKEEDDKGENTVAE